MSERKCQTPDALYQWGLDSRRVLSIKVRFPFDVNDYYAGLLTINEEDDKLTRYDERWAERTRIDYLLHDCLEQFCKDVYTKLQKGAPDFKRPPRTIEEWSDNLFGRDAKEPTP